MFLTRTLYPNDGPAYSLVAEVRWNFPREKLAEVAAIIEGAFKAAPTDRIANELYKLRMLTAGRDQKDASDQEAENVIWLEQLRCFSGDIVIDTLRSWTKPGNPNGKWWPTWNDIAERLQRACDRRQAILNFVRQLAERPDVQSITDQPPTAEQRARAVERWQEMRKCFGASEPKTPEPNPEEVLERLKAEDSPMKAPVTIGAGLLSKIEAIKAGH